MEIHVFYWPWLRIVLTRNVRFQSNRTKSDSIEQFDCGGGFVALRIWQTRPIVRYISGTVAASDSELGSADLRVRANTNHSEHTTLALVLKHSMAEESAKIPTLTPEQQKQLVDDAIDRQERHAESQLEMARLFIDRGRIDIARRRLQEVVELYSKSDSVKEAKELLKGL